MNTVDPSTEEIAEFIRDIDALLRNERYFIINEILLTMDPQDLGLHHCIALIRTPFMFRHKLSNWGFFVEQMYDYIIDVHGDKDPKQILIGLIDENGKARTGTSPQD